MSRRVLVSDPGPLESDTILPPAAKTSLLFRATQHYIISLLPSVACAHRFILCTFCRRVSPFGRNVLKPKLMCVKRCLRAPAAFSAQYYVISTFPAVFTRTPDARCSEIKLIFCGANARCTINWRKTHRHTVLWTFFCMTGMLDKCRGRNCR